MATEQLAADMHFQLSFCAERLLKSPAAQYHQQLCEKNDHVLEVPLVTICCLHLSVEHRIPT